VALADLTYEISPTLGDQLDRVDPEDPDNAVFQFLNNHGLNLFKKGTFSSEERVARGLERKSKGRYMASDKK
jgi:hypothetical protein